MRVYLDNCCYNRPFDDLSQDRVYLEAEAVMAVGAAYFLRQFSAGQGDYTREREKLIEGIAFDNIVNNVRELDREIAKA
ncbi:MAG: hypothetical protein LBE65_04120 [Synergistaceae bacterium]|nr:hypothetical protein [Synergistaceae bacterium]